ncbi:MAG: phosphatidylserine decarboxylase [Desulfobacterales bacterium]|nr:phosphatidylserine decarboxylase [Desulfobacterales bacterium]
MTAFAVLTGLAVVFGSKALTTLFLMGLLFAAYFFRDPERTVPDRRDVYLSPADGKVIVVGPAREERFIGGDALEVGIFMSPLDVHVNRAPCDGAVTSVVHSTGKFFSAFKPEASLLNEQISLLLDTARKGPRPTGRRFRGPSCRLQGEGRRPAPPGGNGSGSSSSAPVSTSISPPVRSLP